jgi:hypothetical protein
MWTAGRDPAPGDGKSWGRYPQPRYLNELAAVGWTKTFTDGACARRSSTGSPSPGRSSRPAPPGTGSPAPAPPSETAWQTAARHRHDAVMHDWPAAPDEIPSPQLVAAWLTLGKLPTERIPLWAAHWIAAGYDGHALAELAGLHGDDPHEVRDLLGPALSDCGVSSPDGPDPSEEREHAAAMVAFTAIARLQASGRAGERWVVDKVIEITEPYFNPSITSLPLERLFVLDDEWEAGWGRTDEQLRAVVRQACAEQLSAARC